MYSVPTDPEHEHHRKRSAAGLWGFHPCCCALWSVAIAGLLLATAAFVLVLVLNNNQGKQIEECCLAPTSVQDLDEGESYSTCVSGSGVAGVTNSSAYTPDECNGFFIVMTRFVTPSGVGSVTALEVCAEFGPIDDPAPGFTAAIYGDDGFGVPTALIASTTTSALTADSLNCLAINATLAESEYIWIAFMTEGSTCDVTNNVLFTTHPSQRSIQSGAFTYPVWPTELAPGYDYLSYVYSMQLSYNASCVSQA